MAIADMKDDVKALDPLVVSNDKTEPIQAPAVTKQTEKIEELHPGAIVDGDIAHWHTDFEKDPTRKVLGNILGKGDLFSLMRNSSLNNSNHHMFNTKLSSEILPVADQASSGRCWMFASLACARLVFAKKHKMDRFQFSAGYLSFYDKLERCNGYLERMIKLVEEPLESRVVQMYNGWAANDGGWAHDSASLIKRYGLVPKAIYNETYNTDASHRITDLLSSKLREYCLEYRLIWENARMDAPSKSGSETKSGWKDQAIKICRARKKQQMSEVYRILAMLLGVPPNPTDKLRFDFTDKDKKFKSITMTPLEYYKSLAPEFDVDDLVVLANDPRHSTGKVYSAQLSDSFVGGRTSKYLNVEAEQLEDAVVKMIKEDMAVWFACDVGQFMSVGSGIMDTKMFDYLSVFGTSLNMNKAQRLSTRDTYPSHAMAIVGTHLDDNGKPQRYRVENSWSSMLGQKGYFVCTSEWLRQHTFIIVVSRKVLSKEMLNTIDTQAPIELAPWHEIASAVDRQSKL